MFRFQRFYQCWNWKWWENLYAQQIGTGQYKNRYNFINICYHKIDFDIDCEWNFFATSHGKGACDGIGGTVKRSVARTSMQRPYQEQILSPEDMYEYCINNLSENITFFYVQSNEVKETENYLYERFEMTKTILGTQKFHKFVPNDRNNIRTYEISIDRNYESKILKKSITENKFTLNEIQIKEGDYIVCLYGEQKWIGFCTEHNVEYDNYKVDFFNPPGLNTYFYFPQNRDSCYISKDKILGVLTDPKLKAGTSRIQYSFIKDEIKKLM